METEKKYNIEKVERRKAFDAPIIDVQKDKGIVRSYVNKFNVIDSYGEMSLSGAFKKTFQERIKKIWWLLNHDYDKSLGVTLSLEEDQFGAIATGKFNLEKQLSRDVFSDYLFFAENDRTLQHSVRVIPVRYVIENEIMKVSEWIMREWSTLTQPGAVEDTPMISIKQANEEKELLEKQLTYAYSDERLKQIEDKISGMETIIKEAAISTSRNETTKQIDETIKFINNLKF
jgi:HK97 family phage prohead protease